MKLNAPSAHCLVSASILFTAHAVSLEQGWVGLADADGIIDQDLPTPQSCEAVEWSPDEKAFATVAKGDFTIRLWDVDKRSELWRVVEDGETESVVFTADGRHVLTGGDSGEIRVRSVADGSLVRALPDAASTEGMRFSPDGTRLASGNEAGQVRIWATDGDPKSWPDEPERILIHGPDEQAGAPAGEHADVNQVDWTPDGTRLVSVGRNRLVKIWDARTGDLLHELSGHNGTIKSVRISPDGRLAASGGSQFPDKRPPATVLIHEVATGREVRRLEFSEHINFEAVAWSPDGKFLLMGGGHVDGGENGRILIANTEDISSNARDIPITRVPVHNQEFLDFDKEGKRLLSGHQDGSVRLWKVSEDSE